MKDEGRKKGRKESRRQNRRGEESQGKYSPIEILTGHPVLMNRVV